MQRTRNLTERTVASNKISGRTRSIHVTQSEPNHIWAVAN